ncbi:MAG: T9SS type A sorting domain-containing protein, partial [bacterium]
MKLSPLFAALILVLLGNPLFPSDTCLNALEVGISFPPVTNAEQRVFAKSHLDSLGIKIIRFSEEWKNREPVQGVFNWKSLDDRIDWAETNGYSILLTVQSNGPDYACDTNQQNDNSCVISDTSAFRQYADTLLKRYSNRISKIQFGNEMISPDFFAGKISDFIMASNILYESTKKYSPQTEFVLGGIATGTLRRFSACRITEFFPFYAGGSWGSITTTGQRDSYCTENWVQEDNRDVQTLLLYANYDIVDLHLYDDPENWHHFISVIKKVVPDKPIIASEFGGPNLAAAIYSDSLHSEQLYQYINKLDSLEIMEAYYFKLVEKDDGSMHAKSGLITLATLEIKPGYQIFKAFQNCQSHIIERKRKSQEPLLKLHPNPFNSTIGIDLKPTYNKASLFVYDISGKLVYKRKNIIKPRILFDASELNHGFYIFKLSYGRQSFCKKAL